MEPCGVRRGRISARVEAIRDDLLQVEERPRGRVAVGLGRAGGVRVSSGLDPFDALRHAREAGLERGDTVAQGDEPIVRGRLVAGAEDRDRETFIRDGQGLLLSGGLGRCLGSALPVGVGLLRLVAAELRLEVEEVDEDLFLVFANPSSLSVSGRSDLSSSPVRVMLCHTVLADQPVFRLRFSDGANPCPSVRDPGESPTPFASS